jgi:hypothetical protein
VLTGPDLRVTWVKDPPVSAARGSSLEVEDRTYLLVCADDLKEVTENSQNNNCRASTALMAVEKGVTPPMSSVTVGTDV